MQIEIDEISKEFGTTAALMPVSLSIPSGALVALLGPSGSGKTTVGRGAIGLLPIKSGKIEIVGTDISNADSNLLKSIRRHTGIVFQDPASSLNPR